MVDVIDKFIDEKISELKECNCEHMASMYETVRYVLKEEQKRGVDFSKCKNLSEMMQWGIGFGIAQIFMDKTK